MKPDGLGTGLLAKRAILSEPFRRFASRTRATLNHELPIIPEHVQQVILGNRVSEDDPVGF